MATTTQWKYLERDPLSSYTQLSIKGRRIRARTLYGRYMSAEEPMTVEAIAADYNLPIEAVQEAITYCQSKPPEIERDFQYEEALVELAGHNEPGSMGRALRSVPPEVKARLRREIYGDEARP
jgi:uncharacterized protein (DUF433 family)